MRDNQKEYNFEREMFGKRKLQRGHERTKDRDWKRKNKKRRKDDDLFRRRERREKERKE